MQVNLTLRDKYLHCLTNTCIKALWLVLPVDSQEIHRDACHHDGQTNTTDHRLRVERKDQQEGPEQQVDHRPNQVHLEDGEVQNIQSIHIWILLLMQVHKGKLYCWL